MRKQHTKEFKAKIAIEALKGEKKFEFAQRFEPFGYQGQIRLVYGKSI